MAPPEAAEVPVDHEDIARLAYLYWERRAGENGSAQDDWFRAESELRSQGTASAGA
ncbi:MAG: DUF2934 domain-containing protein [Bryobacteraceae bacterium]